MSSKDIIAARSQCVSRYPTPTPTSESNFTPWKMLQPFATLADRRKRRDLASEFTTTANAAATNPADLAAPRSSLKLPVPMIADGTNTATRSLSKHNTTTVSTDTVTENIAQTIAMRNQETESAAEQQKSPPRKRTLARESTAPKRGDRLGQKRM